MKTIILGALAALLVALASAAPDFCVIPIPGTNEVVNISNSKPFVGDEAVYVGTMIAFAKIQLSPCKAAVFSTSCTGFAHISFGTMDSCYVETPISSRNGTNTTSMTYEPSNTTSSWLFAVRPGALTVNYVCDPQGTDELAYSTGSQNPTNGAMNLVFSTKSACPINIIPVTPSTTASPLPPKGDDDDGKLSSWAIVGIVVGCVVVVVVVGVVFFKCRKSDGDADGQYSRV